MTAMKKIFLLSLILALSTGCTTTVAVLDVTGSAVMYAGKTIVNTVDALTPDIVND
jgi:uncharacterized protein YcfL